MEVVELAEGGAGRVMLKRWGGCDRWWNEGGIVPIYGRVWPVEGGEEDGSSDNFGGAS